MNTSMFLSIIPTAFSVGANLYLTVLMLGISVRMGWVDNPSLPLTLFGSWWAIVLAIVLYILEGVIGFISDLPGVGKVGELINLVWDVLHMLIAPLAGAFFGLAIAGKGNEAAPALAMVGAIIAFIPQAVKTGSRATMNVTAPLVPLKQSGFNLLKDMLLLALFAFYVYATQHPMLMAGLVVVTLILMFFMVFLLIAAIRWVLFQTHALASRFISFLHRTKESDTLPPEHLALLNFQRPELTVSCIAQTGLRQKSGYVSILNEQILFSHKPFILSPKLWQRNLSANQKTFHYRHLLYDVLEVNFIPAGMHQKRDRISFIFTKDKGYLVDQIAKRLQAERRVSQIEKGVNVVGEKSAEVVELVKDNAQKVLQSGKETAGRTKEALEPKMQEVAGKIQQKVAKGKDALSEGVAQSLDTFDKTRDKITPGLAHIFMTLKNGIHSVIEQFLVKLKPRKKDAPALEQVIDALPHESKDPPADQPL